MTVWTAAANSIHSAIGEAVIYTPSSGDPAIAIQALRSDGTQYAAVGFADVSTPATTWTVLRADVAQPAAGDTVTDADGTVYCVQGEPRMDVERTIWLLDTHPA